MGTRGRMLTCRDWANADPLPTCSLLLAPPIRTRFDRLLALLPSATFWRVGIRVPATELHLETRSARRWWEWNNGVGMWDSSVPTMAARVMAAPNLRDTELERAGWKERWQFRCRKWGGLGIGVRGERVARERNSSGREGLWRIVGARKWRVA
jgi:hypothetical protein